MAYRTFKCFSTCIELRAYLPNTKVANLAAVAEKVVTEMKQTLFGDNDSAYLRSAPPLISSNLELASNRAGLHLAYLYHPTDHSNLHDSMVSNHNDYRLAINALQAAGWKMCQGN